MMNKDTLNDNDLIIYLDQNLPLLQIEEFLSSDIADDEFMNDCSDLLGDDL